MAPSLLQVFHSLYWRADEAAAGDCMLSVVQVGTSLLSAVHVKDNCVLCRSSTATLGADNAAASESAGDSCALSVTDV